MIRIGMQKLVNSFWYQVVTNQSKERLFIRLNFYYKRFIGYNLIA